MPRQVVESAQLMCSFGTSPCRMAVPPKNSMWGSHDVGANILDHIPMVNIMPFGMCSCPANPQVATATAAAMGVLTPQPCIPCTATPWAPGAPGVFLCGAPQLNDVSTLTCNWGGVITVADPGQQAKFLP